MAATRPLKPAPTINTCISPATQVFLGTRLLASIEMGVFDSVVKLSLLVSERQLALAALLAASRAAKDSVERERLTDDHRILACVSISD